MKKAGAHKKDQAAIARMVEAKASVANISNALNIEEGVVAKFVAHFEKGPKKGKK